MHMTFDGGGEKRRGNARLLVPSFFPVSDLGEQIFTDHQVYTTLRPSHDIDRTRFSSVCTVLVQFLSGQK